MKVLIESMTRVEFLNRVIRCWREEKDYSSITEQETTLTIHKTLENLSGSASRQGIAEELLKIENMNAVEVLDAEGHGCVFYKDWP